MHVSNIKTFFAIQVSAIVSSDISVRIRLRETRNGSPLQWVWRMYPFEFESNMNLKFENEWLISYTNTNCYSRENNFWLKW